MMQISGVLIMSRELSTFGDFVRTSLQTLVNTGSAGGYQSIFTVEALLQMVWIILFRFPLTNQLSH